MIIVSDTTIGQTLPGDCGGEQGRGHGHALPRRQVTEDRLTGSNPREKKEFGSGFNFSLI